MINKEKIINELQEIVNQNVRFWKTDFLIDKKQIKRKQNTLPMIFIARENGTLLISFTDTENWYESEIETYCKLAEEHVKYYLEDDSTKIKLFIINKNEVKAIKKKEAIKEALYIINNNKNKLIDYINSRQEGKPECKKILI